MKRRGVFGEWRGGGGLTFANLCIKAGKTNVMAGWEIVPRAGIIILTLTHSTIEVF